MKDFEGNSFVKQQEKLPKVANPVTPVVSENHVQAKKTGELKRLAKSFFARDFKDVAKDVIKDVLMPGLKRTFADIIKSGVDMMIYDDSAQRRTNDGRGILYSSYFGNSARVERPGTNLQPVRSNVFIVNDVTYDTKVDADNVLYTLRDLISRYNKASVEDFYNASNLKPNFTDSKWGWTNLDNAYVYLSMNRWAIKLPKAEPLE